MDPPGTGGVGALQIRQEDVAIAAVDLFTRPSKEVSLKASSESFIRPIGSISQTGPYEFRFPNHGPYHFLQPSATRVVLVLQITKPDGTLITDDVDAHLINLAGSSFIKDVEIDLNGVNMTELRNNLACYKTYLETVLTYNKTALESHMQSAFFYLDDNGRYDDFDKHKTTVKVGEVAIGTDIKGDFLNFGMTNRWVRSGNSRKVQIVSPLNSDFFQSEKVIPPGVNIVVKLSRSNDDFMIMQNLTGPNDNTKYVVKVVDIKLHVRHIEVTQDYLDYVNKTILIKPAVIPINKTVVKTFTIPKGGNSTSFPNLFFGTLPKSILFAAVETEGFQGRLNKNPFYFQHFNRNSIQLKLNGKYFPSEGLKPDHTNGLDIFEYRWLFDQIGVQFENMGCACTLEQWRYGCNIYGYDFSPCLCNGYHKHEKNTGTIDLDITYSKDLEKSITYLVFGTYDGEIEIDSNYNCTTNIPI